VTETEITIQVLTCSALVGLLGAVGLRLTWQEVKTALKQCRVAAILVVNFVAIPLLALGVGSGFGLRRELVIAMILLAASPFAPVVPVFARMARADLALAAGLTGVFPLASAFLTPLVVQAALMIVSGTGALRYNLITSLTTLVTIITLPLAFGVFVRHRAPLLARALLRPIEVISEGLGAVSLTFATATQFGSIMNLGWRAWLAMALVSEISLLLGWKVGGPDRAARRVVALGTSNRNIALALLIAIQSFHGMEVASAVVGNGLLLIGLGLLHVAWWRFQAARRSSV
jgi:bile acid:Na+ symporter, BASS family